MCHTIIHESNVQELAKLKQLQKRRALKEPVLNARRTKLEIRLLGLGRKIDSLMREKFFVKYNYPLNP